MLGEEDEGDLRGLSVRDVPGIERLSPVVDELRDMLLVVGSRVDEALSRLVLTQPEEPSRPLLNNLLVVGVLVVVV